MIMYGILFQRVQIIHHNFDLISYSLMSMVFPFSKVFILPILLFEMEVMKEKGHYLKVNVSSENKIKLMYTTFFMVHNPDFIR